MADTVPYKPRAGEIPTEPGVYRFRDEQRRILYVGKAKNLRARLSNYFQPLHRLHERTRRMVLSAASVEWTIVGSEFEALQLEFTWIKEFNPPFNVQFRDDKSYPYLAITLGDEVPRVVVTRNRRIPGAKYFGPYTKVWAVRETVDLMLKVFPMRSCGQSTFDRAKRTNRPCLLGDIGKCAAPCVGRVPLDEHQRIARDFASFMAGNDRGFVEDIRQRMLRASDALDFERAATLRDQLAALDAVLARTTVVLRDGVDADVFGIAQDELAAAVHLFRVRGGRIRGTRSWVVDTELDITTPELVTQALRQAYDGEDPPPKEVLVPSLPGERAQLEEWLTSLRLAGAARVEVRVPQRGEKRAILDSANVNAAHALQLHKTRRTSDYGARSQALADLQHALGMTEVPLRIECFDISHLHGTDIVASMVVFEDGLPRKDQYRKFQIAHAADDTAAMYEVLTRRAKYLIEGDPETEDAAPRSKARFAYPPQLLLVDGGQPQVNAARRALDDAGVTGIALAGIAKRLEELWLPNEDFPVILPRGSEALFLVQRLRDEAHRFAITYQRQKRSSQIQSELSGIEGLGPSRVKALIRHFGSAKRVRAATAAELAEVDGIGPALAERVHLTLAETAPDGTQQSPDADRLEAESSSV